jgi:WD40 repeat protein
MTAAAPRLLIDEQNPWPGLSAFDEAAERFFNGRDEERAALRRLVLNAPLTLLFGASGLGKTSLLQAGLFPLLRKDHVLPVYVRLDPRDRSRPLIDQLTLALDAEVRRRRVDVPAFREDESLWEVLHRSGLEFWSAQNRLLTPLFVIDQFEEVFTLGAGNPEATARLRIDLADLIENRLPAAVSARLLQNDAAAASLSVDSQRYRVLLSFREDFLPAVEGWKHEIPSMMRNRLRLLAMSDAQAFQAVHGTAPHLAGDEIAHRIVAFVAAAREDASVERAGDLTVEPALLSLVCHGLNERRKAEGKTSFDDSLLKGTGQAIIADFYERSVADLSPAAQRFIVRELITERGFRKPCDVDDARSVHGVTDAELRLLVDRRLLRIEPVRGGERVELTHDLLTRVVREHRERQRERERLDRERRTRRRLTLVGAGLGVVALTMGWLYFRAEAALDEAREQSSVAKAALADSKTQTKIAEAQTKIAVAATKTATTEAKRAQVSADLAEGEARAALAHLLAGAALNAAADGARETAIQFALSSIGLTRDATGLVYSDAEDSLRRVTAPAGMNIPRLGHSAEITRVVVSPDGNRVATAGEDGVRIWDARIGEQLVHLSSGACSGMVFSRDWKRLACPNPNPGESRVWDVDTGAQLETISSMTVTGGRSRPIKELGFTPDGALLARDTDKIVVLSNRSERMEFPGTQAAISPDGRLVATEVGTTARIFELSSGKERASLRPPGGFTGLLWSPDSKHLLTLHDDPESGTEEGDYLFDVTSGESVRQGPQQGCSVFWPDGSRLVRGRTFPDPAAGGIIRGVEIRNLPKGPSRELRLPGIGGIHRCAVSPDGSSLVTFEFSEEGQKQTASVWNVAIGEPTLVHQLAGARVAASLDGNVLANADGRSVGVQNHRASTTVTLPEQAARVTAAVFSPDRQRIVTAEGNRGRVWDVRSGRRLFTLIGHRQELFALAYSRDGSLIATGGIDTVIKLWDARSGAFLRDLVGHTGRIMSIAFSPDSRRIATAGDSTVRLWDAATGKELTPGSPIRGKSSPLAVAFSSDGARLVFGGNDLSLWDAVGHRELAALPQGHGLPAGLTLTRNARYLVLAEQQGVRLWRQGSEWFTLPGSAGGSVPTPVAMDLSRDGMRLVTPGTETTVRIWEIETRKEVKTLHYSGDGAMRAVAFSVDETEVHAVTERGVLYRFPLILDTLVAETRKLASGSSIADEHCLKYLHQECPAQLRKP